MTPAAQSSSIGALTVAEVAKELRVSTWTVRQEIASGALTGMRVGRSSLRVLRSDLDLYVQRKRGGAA